MNRFLWYWAPVLTLCAALFIQSSFPSLKTELSFQMEDKLWHMAAYGVLAALFYRAGWATWHHRFTLHQLVWISICFASLYGLSDEIHQAFVPSRHFDLYDVAADIAGSIVGSVGYLKIRTFS